MLTADIIRPSALSARDRAAWQAIRSADPAFASPLFSLEFAEAVAGVRPDAAIAVLRQGGRTVGFLAHHRRPGGVARPIGAPFSDYHGLVAEPGLDGLTVLRAARLKEYRFTALVDPHGAFAAAEGEAATSYAMALGEGADAGVAYLEGLRANSPKRFKNLRRLDHKLEREVGEVALVAPDRDPAAFELMFAWKRAQFARTGLHDVFAPLWVRRLMAGLFERTEGRLRGYMLTLNAGDRAAAMHFGVREGERYHPWVAAQDEALAAYSPGQLFLWRAVEAMPALGLRWYDLAGGHDHYKLPYASETISVASGRVAVRAGVEAAAWRLAEHTLGDGLSGRVRRRLEQIASTELTTRGRLAGLAGALAGRKKRLDAAPRLQTPAVG